MATRPTFLLLLAAVAVPAPSSVPARIKPHPSAHRMASEARAVIEGRPGPAGGIVVTHRHFTAPGVVVGDTLVVPSLPGMPRRPFDFAGGGAPIEPDAVLLFLGDEPQPGEWAPLHLDAGRARGVLWFVDGAVYGYCAVLSDGPYELMRWHALVDGTVVDATVADVRAEVAAGLEARARWQATLAIAGAAERARAVAGWYGPGSPDGRHWHERLGPICARRPAGSARRWWCRSRG